MIPALPPMTPQPAASQSRDTAGAVGVDAQRPQRAVRAAETARAVRPVEAGGPPADARLNKRRDQPVGPPPAFTINLLQHLRETALDPPEPVAEDAGSAATGRDEAVEAHGSRDAPTYATARLAAEDPGPPQVDLKL